MLKSSNRGDLELDADDSDISANDKGVDMAVETKSTKASKIKISGVEGNS